MGISGRNEKGFEKMELIIAELSRYVIIILFAVYTFYSFRSFSGKSADQKESVFCAQ